MDVDAFALSATRAGIGNVMPFFPGNAQPVLEIPKFSNPEKKRLVGEGYTENTKSSWTDYLGKAIRAAAFPLTASIDLGHSALKEVAGAADRSVGVFSRASDAAVSAATGIASWTKWVVIGIIALVVGYVVFMVSPTLRRVQGA